MVRNALERETEHMEGLGSGRTAWQVESLTFVSGRVLGRAGGQGPTLFSAYSKLSVPGSGSFALQNRRRDLGLYPGSAIWILFVGRTLSGGGGSALCGEQRL